MSLRDKTDMVSHEETDKNWIPVATYSNWVEEQIDKAIAAAYQTHLWTLGKLSAEYQQHIFVVDIARYKASLTRHINQERLYRGAQRFTLDQAMLKTISWFRDTDKYTRWDAKFPPKPIKAEEYKEIEIAPRKIWPKYLEEYGQISTTFGMLTLEGEWRRTLYRQAKEWKIAPKELPEHWRSLTIKKEDGGYKIKFNAR